MATTIDKPLMARLSYAQTDPLANLVYNQAFPAMDAQTEHGKFREVEARAHYLQVLAENSSKYTTPETFDYTDSFRYFRNVPISMSFMYSVADLNQPQVYGYATAAEMINAKRRWQTNLLKKHKEKALYTAVSDNNNFEGATYYANAGTAWSTVSTSDPISDVAAGKLIVPEVNAGIMSYTAFLYCQRNANLKATTTVYGPRRDNAVDPTITAEFLRNAFALDYLWIARGSLITDSADESDETRAEIWGDKMLLFYHNPTLGPEEPAWMKHLFWRPSNGAESGEGWLVTETIDQRAGGAGVRHWDLWNYYQFLVQEKSLAYRIDNLY